jgi:hypothetical protein
VLWGILPAAAVGAGHLRERLCLIAAHPESLPEWPGLRPTGEKNQNTPLRRRRSSDPHLPADAPHTHDPRLQRHARHVRQPQRRHTTAGSIAPRDLRGRVSGPQWWHEANTGIPVLAHGIPTKLAEAASRCTGNAIVPQAFHPILAALRAQI